MSIPHASSRASLRIVGVGQFLPPRIVTSAELDRRLGLEAGWIARHTGVETRHYVEAETAAEMGASAVQQALKAVPERDWKPDLVLGASGAPQQPIPCTAALIAAEIGWNGVPCFDVNATCLSFLAALVVSDGLLRAGTYSRIAIVSSEISSKGLNWKESEAAGLLGDGAAAVLLEAGEAGQSELIRSVLETWPEGAAFTEIRGGGSKLPAKDHCPGVNTEEFLFHMNGPAVFRLAAEKMEPFVARLIGSDPGRWDGIDWVVPHQASLPGIRHLQRRLRIPPEKLVETIRRQGNVIAASIPLALHDLLASGRLQRGQTILFLGTSAGFSLGGVLLRY